MVSWVFSLTFIVLHRTLLIVKHIHHFFLRLLLALPFSWAWGRQIENALENLKRKPSEKVIYVHFSSRFLSVCVRACLSLCLSPRPCGTCCAFRRSLLWSLPSLSLSHFCVVTENPFFLFLSRLWCHVFLSTWTFCLSLSLALPPDNNIPSVTIRYFIFPLRGSGVHSFRLLSSFLSSTFFTSVCSHLKLMSYFLLHHSLFRFTSTLSIHPSNSSSALFSSWRNEGEFTHRWEKGEEMAIFTFN